MSGNLETNSWIKIGSGVPMSGDVEPDGNLCVNVGHSYDTSDTTWEFHPDALRRFVELANELLARSEQAAEPGADGVPT